MGIIDTAYKIRRTKFWDGARANGHCYTLSKLLAKAYEDEGYPAKMIEGTFYPEYPIETNNGYFHCWVNLYDFIIDVTANQFDDIEEDVLIAPYEYYPQYHAEILVITTNNITLEINDMREPKKIPWTQPRKGKSRKKLREEFEQELYRKHAMLQSKSIEPTTGHDKTDARLILKYGEFQPTPILDIPTYVRPIIEVESNEIPFRKDV